MGEVQFDFTVPVTCDNPLHQGLLMMAANKIVLFSLIYIP